MARSPAVPYVTPFAAFLIVLALGLIWPLTGAVDQITRIAALLAVLWWVARPILDFQVRSWAGSVLIGVVIFVLWIAPDLLFPAYRHLGIFNNSIVGHAHSSLPSADQLDPVVMGLRTFRAAILVPVIEELFWRGWLMRWIIAPDFRKVAPGAYSALSFWVVALLFASEHGPYWDVGLMAGILFNFWMIRTKSLGDVILAHAIANLCLSVYVIAEGKWEYWL